jgi:hypothetical protein
MLRCCALYRSLCNDLKVDLLRFQEESKILKVELDGAQKKCGQYRKLAMALQAAAAHVVSAPQRSTLSTQDETDKQVQCFGRHCVFRHGTSFVACL